MNPDTISLLESPIEELLYNAMKEARIDYITDIRPQEVIGKYRVDFLLIPKHGKTKGVIVECDGAYHQKEEQQQKDRERTAYLIGRGYSLIRFSGKTLHEYYVNQYHDGISPVDKIKTLIMENAGPYATGKEFIEMVDKEGNLYLVPK